MSNCAKRGSPSGGAKDTIAPVVLKSSPENFTTSFDGQEVRITFDEFVRLNDLQTQLIVSPPLDYPPDIRPYNTSKTLRIRLIDTLEENTTYSLNFGNSIVDNNEGNPYPYFKYVFSTGSYIDSLSLEGIVNDPLRTQPSASVTIMLYAEEQLENDSIIFTEKPTYITTTRDTTFGFRLDNLKAGRYRLIALQEATANYTFQPDTDLIAFHPTLIELPTDSTYLLQLFKEEPDYAIGRPRHAAKYRIQFGYQGDDNGLSLEPLGGTPDGFESITLRSRSMDTLQYWFKPAIDVEQTDTLYFMARKGEQSDSVVVRMRDLYADSLQLALDAPRTLTPLDTFKLTASTPMFRTDPERIEIMAKDSTEVPFELELDREYNRLRILFDRTEDNSYRINLYPGAITDFYEASHDTLQLSVRTASASDYGTISMNLVNAKQFPMLVQLVTEDFSLVQEQYLTAREQVYFEYLPPGKYYVRLIEDSNSNRRWDTGNYLRAEQPEKVIFYPKPLVVRANWSLNEQFILQD
jgi:uncharacterized protein (DUF2141 family)